MKKITLLILSCILYSAFTSCQSKEESVISKLQAISEQIEEKGDIMTDEDWNKLEQKHDEIMEYIKTCSFTDEQEEQLIKIESKIATQTLKQKGKDFGKSVKSILKKGKGIVDGIKEGLKDNDEE